MGKTVFAHWYAVFDNGEELRGHRLYASEKTALRYLMPYITRRFIRIRKMFGIRCIEFGYGFTTSAAMADKVLLYHVMYGTDLLS